MQRLICKSKIHGIYVTGTDLHYEGSIEIDGEILEKADILPHEIVQVINIANGERFETYVLSGKKGKGACRLYGGAARLGKKGDELIIISYAILETVDARTYKPKIIRVNRKNQMVKKGIK